MRSSGGTHDALAVNGSCAKIRVVNTLLAAGGTPTVTTGPVIPLVIIAIAVAGLPIVLFLFFRNRRR